MQSIIKRISILFFTSVLFTNVNAINTLDSLRLRISNGSSEDQANAYLALASHYFQTAPDSSIYFASKSLLIANELNHIVLQTRSYSTIAEGYQRQSKIKESIQYYLKSIEISEANNEISTVGSAYNGLGIDYYYLQDFDKSEYYLKKAAANKLQLKDYTHYSVILTNLAGIYYYKQNYKDAIHILTSAEEVLIQANQKEYLASLYNSLGGAYQMGYNNLDSADYYYKKSLEIAKEYNVVNNIITAYHNLGHLNSVQKKYADAIFYLKKAEEQCQLSPGNAFEITIYSTLSEIYDSIADYKNAFKYKRLQFELNKKLFQNEKQKAIDELEIKYQTAKKEKEIEQQKEELQTSKLLAEQANNRQNVILFSVLVLLLTTIFIAVYFWQRKRANQVLEKEKSKLFENIIHEIRTPLTLINGPLQLVKKEMQNSQLNDHIDLIEQNSQKLVGLVNELLDASKLEKGKYQLAFQRGDINYFIKEIIESFTQEARNKNIVINFFPTEKQESIVYPANAIEKIAVNLISNAIKYCPKHSTVKVSLQVENDQLTLLIADDGPGIPEKEQQKIFERFYRLKHSENINGTGIGLSLVKDLVDLMKADLKLESTAGKGSTFTIKIPVTKMRTEEIEFESDDSKPYLLIIEDDQDLIKFISSLFKSEFNISVAQNGQEGIEKVNSELPNIILTDVMMPLKTGLEVLQEVKSNNLTNHIPVVVFSAKASLESRLEGLKYGADAYVPKPFNPDEIVLIIQNLLKTIRRNQQEFQTELKTEKVFEDRVRSKNEYVNQAIAFVVKNMDQVHYSVNELAADMCISRSQLHRKLNALTGFSTTNFIKMVRLEKSKDLLQSNWGNVTEVAYACGFSSQSYFTKSFTEYFGESPSKMSQNSSK